MNKFVRLSPESGDWEAWYLNGKLIAEGHSVRVTDMLDALSDVFPNEYTTKEISDVKAELGFENNLEDMLSKKSCAICRFFDWENDVCMYKCQVKAILNCAKSAENCKEYNEGEFDIEKLERSNYL